MRDRWRIAIVDSGIAGPAISCHTPVVSCRFVDDGGAVHTAPAIDDPLGHGAAVARVICSSAVDLLVAQVLDHRGRATPAAVASAIVWSVDSGANLIHMSLGLREHRDILAAAVDVAVRAGCIVVASAPARGECTYPARYSHVIRATGDARCRPDEISELRSPQADFGGCPHHARRPGSTEVATARPGGASLGAAHLTRFLVDHVDPGKHVATVRAHLMRMASYHGAERRSQSIL